MSSSKKWISEYRKKYVGYDYDIDTKIRQTLSGIAPKNQNFTRSTRRAGSVVARNGPGIIEPTVYSTEYSEEYRKKHPETAYSGKSFKKKDQEQLVSWNSNHLGESTYQKDFNEDNTTLGVLRGTSKYRVAGTPRHVYDPNDHRLQRLEKITDANPFDFKVRGDISGSGETTYHDHYRDFYDMGPSKQLDKSTMLLNHENETPHVSICPVERVENTNPFDIETRNPVYNDGQSIYRHDYVNYKKDGSRPRLVSAPPSKTRSIRPQKLVDIQEEFPFEIGTTTRPQIAISTIYQDNYVNHPRYERMRKLED